MCVALATHLPVLHYIEECHRWGRATAVSKTQIEMEVEDWPEEKREN